VAGLTAFYVRAGPVRTRAVVIYPMNALANSQLEELEKYTSNVAGGHPR